MTESATNWPPQPGEVWVADGEWPTYGFAGSQGLEIVPGDVFLVTETLEEYTKDDDDSFFDESRKFVKLIVLIHGRTRVVMSECFNGVPDMHKLEETNDVP